jgi:hypothetical protein
MKLEVHPDETLVDQPLRTVVCKRERVSLPCAGTSALSWRLALAGATFIADGNGRIDLNTGAPISGTYEGIDQMGFYWSMELAPMPRN